MKIFLIAFVCLTPLVALGADDCATRRIVPEDVLSLQDVIKLGMCRNPQTAAAYASLRSSHFNKNAGYANYLPSVFSLADDPSVPFPLYTPFPSALAPPCFL